MRKLTLAAAAAALALTGCATHPDKLATTSASAIQYQNYNCDQVGLELDRINSRVGELHNELATDANNDAAQMAIGMLLFWPALFLLEGGDGPEAAEYSRLKGQAEALQTASVQKQCELRLAGEEEGTVTL